MTTKETLHLPAMHGTAEIWRDAWGIPHVRAGTDHDAFAALGWVHAQDRLFQMESTVRKAVGRWSEWVGAAGLAGDRLARIMNAETAARRDVDNLGDEARGLLDSYAVGVNGFIAQGQFPPEFAILSCRPTAWEPWHSIAVMRQTGFLLGAVWMKLFRAAALPIVGADTVAKLRYDDGGNDRLCLPWSTDAARWQMDIDALRPSIEALLTEVEPGPSAGGSNSWVVGGALTPHGHPILMGDPHRELETPAMYAQAHVKSESFDVIGLTVPGVPGFPHVAHNAHVAWCVTVACMDLHDFYIEHFRQQGSEVRTAQGWEPTRRRTETIQVRDAAPVVVEVFETSHGPVVSGDPRSGLGIALRSAQFLDSDRSIDCLLRMLRARNVQALREATRGWGLVDHNLVAADIDGNIAHWVRARVPQRPRANGWLPVPGWLAEHEWQGIVPFDDMPGALNPPEHRIVTANNRVTADRDTPYLSTDCYPPHRARRIAERLEALETRSASAMEAIFADDLSLPARLFIEKLTALRIADPAASALRARIVHWDGHMDRHSHAASAYACLRLQLTEVVVQWSGLNGMAEASPSGATLGSTAALNQLWWIVPALLREDDTCLLGSRSWNDALAEALLRESLLTRSAAAWGDLHLPAVKHPLATMAPQFADRLNPPSAPIGGDADTVMATGFTPAAGLATTFSALARYSFDLADWNDCRWIVFQGASGIPGDAHALDQNAAWASNATIPMLFDWSRITDD